MDMILTSTVIAAIVAGFVAAWTAQQKISIKNITQDRRSWRDKVREKSLTVHDALVSRDKELLDKLRVEFRVILNPEDKDDNWIIKCIHLPDEGKELERAEEFAERIALLLKHDWERVKLEAGPLVMRIKVLRNFIGEFSYKPVRVKYERNNIN